MGRDVLRVRRKFGRIEKRRSAMTECVFCRILAGELPAHYAYHDDQVVAFLSLEQPTPYKVLVLPWDHIEMIYDLSDDLAAAIFQATVRVARAVREVSNCEGLNLVQSNGEVGQQDVFHFHLHIVPRFRADEIVLGWDNTPAPTALLERYAQEINDHLG
ncbi:MAG: HIT domain-containing protein [Anaerolineales bacterium]|nr:MAG: HIT domain-containing protein [Anaerolineales bacterium]